MDRAVSPRDFEQSQKGVTASASSNSSYMKRQHRSGERCLKKKVESQAGKQKMKVVSSEG